MFAKFTQYLNNAKTIKKLGSYLVETPGMNAAIRSVVRTCAYHIECIGFIEVIRDDRRGF
jgi:hypothetical protein